MAGCRLAGSMAFVDPVFAYAAPKAARAFSAVARTVATLPGEGASALMFAGLDSNDPRVVFLSPLLASEIRGILSRNADTLVAYIGEADPAPDPRLFAAVFSSVDAASLAGQSLAARSGKNEGADASSVGAIFRDSREAEAFIAAYNSAGGEPSPVVEIAASGYSQAVADRFKALDIGSGYVSASPRDVERWVREAFDSYAFVVTEYPLPPDRPVSAASASIVWDFDGTLEALRTAVEDRRPGSMPGKWRFQLSRRGQ
ncbi:MAG: hypothetical protein CVV51_03100 [Spirochaetae bacterium HGW-Spirochaetae-7]|jgi:hypothetical protein|nr:MAG: hypothetical protein CVV51_03100 [Spirochaetae bacterium HGW-Spirochaetae-7]